MGKFAFEELSLNCICASASVLSNNASVSSELCTWILSENVVTPAMLTLSKFVWPSTSKSPLASMLPVKVELPDTSKFALRSILLRNVEIPPWTPTSKFLSTVRSRYENVEIPEVGAPVCPTYL